MSKLPAGQHLKELRTRFFFVAIFFIAGACLAYTFQEQVIDAVLAPLGGRKLVYLNVAGGFNFIFLISIYAGLALAIPLLIQQLYAFVRPALPSSAHKKSSSLIIGSFFLLFAGILFGYFVAVPNAMQFLYSFADQYIDSNLTADSYLNFIIAYTIGIGLVFQIPLVLLLINTIKPLTPGWLMKSERWVILLSVIVAAVITPTPDPINQLIIAGPVIIVYQIGVVIILLSIHKRYRTKKREARKLARLQKSSQSKRKAAKKTISSPAPQYVPRPATHAAAPAFVAHPQTVRRTSPGLQSMQGMVSQQKPLHQRKATMPPSPSKPQQKPVHKPTTGIAMDGFKRPARPAVQAIYVPKRIEKKAEPAARIIPRPASPNQRNFTIDGMYRPFQSGKAITN